MRSFAVATAVVALWVCPTHAVQSSNMFASTSHDFGTVARAAKTEHRFYFDNPYDRPLHVRSARTSCGCTTPIVETQEVPPRGRGSILARFNTDTHTGQRAATLTVTFDRPSFSEVQLHVKGYVRTDVVFNPGEASFGNIQQGKEKTVTVALDYAGRSDWQIKGLATSEAFFSATAQEESRNSGRVRYNLSLTMSDQAPEGPFQSELIVVTNDRNLTKVPLRVMANIVAGITASPTTVSLGDILAQEPVKQLIVLKSQSPFLIKSVNSNVFDVDVKLSEEAKAIQAVQLMLKAKEGEYGRETQGFIRFETDLADRPEIEVGTVFRLKAPAPAPIVNPASDGSEE